MSQPTEEEMEGLGWELVPDPGFVGLVGPFWRHRSDTVSRFAFLSADKHRNRRGVVQGGMLMTFADRAMGSAARRNDPAIAQATVQFSMNFLDAAYIGEMVEIESTVERRTRSIVFVNARLTQGERVVATATGVWKILRPRPEV